MTNFPGTVALNNSGGFLRFNGSAGGPNATFELGNGNSTLNNRNGVTVILGALTGGSGTFLSGAGAVDAPSTYLIGSKNISTTFNGTVRDANSARIVNINKIGAGTWTLSNTNAYTGTTIVSAGTLLVNGNQSASTGNVTVGAAGTLGGTGVVGGNTTVNGTLAPGTSIGTLMFNGNLTLAASATSLFELSHSPLTNDVARVLGSVTLAGTLNVLNIDPDLLEAGDSFQLFAATNFTGSFSSINLPPLDAGLLWVTNSLSVNGTIYVITDTNPAPPFISNVAATPQVTSAIITWDTLTESTSQVEYGFTTNYANVSPSSSALTADHAVLLTGLTPDTNYYFRVISKTGTNVFRSATASFNTAGGVIVDNPAASFFGSWTLGTSATDKYGTSYQFALATAAPSPSAQATYTPNIPAAGLTTSLFGIPPAPIALPMHRSRSSMTAAPLFAASIR
jgi:autotransporter-associated beta strand protein